MLLARESQQKKLVTVKHFQLIPTSASTQLNSLTAFYLLFGNFLRFSRAFHSKFPEFPPTLPPSLT